MENYKKALDGALKKVSGPYIPTAEILPEAAFPWKIMAPATPIETLKSLRVLDEQDAVRRYTWYNLPKGLDGDLIERILYYRYQGAFFYLKANDTFWFLPFTLNGNIDAVGRYKGITPVTFNGSTKLTATGIKDGKRDNSEDFIEDKVWKPVYDLDINEFLSPELQEEGCVILKDYIEQQSQVAIPRQVLQEPILNFMSDIIPYARTSLITHSGVKGIRVENETDADSVAEASRAMDIAAKTGRGYIPIYGKIDFQELTEQGNMGVQEYLMLLQAMDNYRLSFYGLPTGGLFQKSSHMLEAENDMNAGHARIALDDGLAKRQRFCELVNAIWGLAVSVEISETALGLDKDNNGEASSDETPGEQPVGEEGGSEDEAN